MKIHRTSLALFILLIILYHSSASVYCQTKPIKGTWLNLTYQDVRNKYMNPAHIDNTNPVFWQTKVQELANMGIKYLVIMAVANEGKSFYPSEFMPPAYNTDRISPVEAIVNTADKYDMCVFMSSGWAKDQDDDLRRPEIREIQLKIMKETADRFGDHKSFYGWYLPVEDSMEPILSDHAVDAVNFLTAEARRLTPNKQVMISPYGLCNADMRNKKFGEQIAKLNVDIIAYQDEVGCIREPMPMLRMKEHFKILGEIHKRTGIKFWANNESFTWEKGTNSRESALIPAAFPRFLSQITGVTEAGVDEIISFSIYGIYDKPDSEMPIGQPCLSMSVYKDYEEWKNRKGRWALLEATFRGPVKHEAIGKKTELRKPSLPPYNKGDATDKNLGIEDYRDSNWSGFKDVNMEVVVDLETNRNIQVIAARFMNYKPQSIELPSAVDFYLSNDGENFRKVKTVIMVSESNDLHDCWIDLAFVDNLSENARYLKIVAENREGSWIFCDELMVNPDY